ncbi:putative transcription factor interactor and regulator CCHC(Zn) family [Helianthus annuus]|nr:putative transcription factor interactor and regulator CCHC(Zn) family [Helianthus annuus]
MENSSDLKKDEEDFIKLPESNSPGGGSVNGNNHSSMPSEADSQPIDSGVKEGQLNGEVVVIEKIEHAQVTLTDNKEHDLTSVEVNTSTVIENRISVSVENGSLVQDGTHKRTASPSRNSEIDAVSGSKRPRITVDEQQASVHIVYNSITRESKQKLEELLQKWSEWHARHTSSSRDSKDELESGEGTYYPALNIGSDKSSAVSFWMDGQTRNLQSKEVITLDNNSVPLYDRGYSFGLTSADGPNNLEGGLEIVDGSRCFNCGSYNHALKECQKPRDNAAVNNARKQHKAKRNQNSISRNPTRYYQDTPGGKFDGLRPGVLDPETRKLLGLGELDPPPWLNRMREIGYPPGYLDAEEEDQPSGIEIFGDDEVVVKQETEDGEILDMDISPPHGGGEPPKPEPPKKMSVQFPGVNAPIPENADEWRWGARAWKFDLPRSRSSNHRYHDSTESPASSRHRYPEDRWNRDYRDDGPPGVDPVIGSLPSSFSPRYPGYDSRGSSYGRRSPLIRETSSSHDDDRWHPYSSDSSSHRRERHEDRHHRSWR